ncbi:MAG: universal stress protein [bacterium]
MTPTLSATSRPRVLGWIRSAAFLDGDWGTSIAYVLGIGFTLAGYSSFWHLMMMLGLTTLVALNYITLCRLYPNGGGVYSSVYHRSRALAVVGALLLGADYVITMSLSVLDAFHYFDFAHPNLWAIGVIIGLGLFNWYGPKHSGVLAFGISLVTLLTLLILMGASAPTALTESHIAPPSGGFFRNWGIFVGLILSISGIEAISNMTGLMKNPARDSRLAIIAVLAKVITATIFLGLAMHAVPQLTPHTEDMVRFLGEYYVAHWFGWIVALVLGLLLISAGNTALNGLISIQFLMSVDNELPAPLRRINKYGVPVIPLIISTLTPVLVLLITHDIMILAHLYAIGVVGAVLINIGSTATDRTLKLPRHTRLLMGLSAVILFFVELSIAIEKPQATLFASIILFVGLGARYLAVRKARHAFHYAEAPAAGRAGRRQREMPPSVKFLVAVRGKSEQLLRFAISEARAYNAQLLVLRVKEIAVGTLPEKMLMVSSDVDEWLEDKCAEAGIDFQVIVFASNEVGYTIAEQAALFGVDRVIMGVTRRGIVEAALKGDVIRVVSHLLPEEIQLVIFGGGAEAVARVPEKPPPSAPEKLPAETIQS